MIDEQTYKCGIPGIYGNEGGDQQDTNRTNLQKKVKLSGDKV